MAKRVSNIYGNEQANKANPNSTTFKPDHDVPRPQGWNPQNSHQALQRRVKTSPTSWTSACRPSRREKVTLCRLRIRHTKLTHGHLMEGAPPPISCGVQLTLSHILTQYRQQFAHRLQHLPSQNLKQILSDNEHSLSNLFTYLNLTQL
jgi:hypothetical protein